MYRPLSNRDKLVRNSWTLLLQRCTFEIEHKKCCHNCFRFWLFKICAHASFTLFQLFKGTQCLLLKIVLCFTEYCTETMQLFHSLSCVFIGLLVFSFVLFSECVSNTIFKHLVLNNVNSLHIQFITRINIIFTHYLKEKMFWRCG